MVRKTNCCIGLYLLLLMTCVPTQVRPQEDLSEVQVEFDSSLFDTVSDIEEPDVRIKMIERTPKLTFSELPLYCKLLYSYVYEEKLKGWYHSIVGYLSELQKEKR